MSELDKLEKILERVGDLVEFEENSSEDADELSEDDLELVSAASGKTWLSYPQFLDKMAKENGCNSDK